MTSRKTWVWVLGTGAVLVTAGLVGVAGAGVYFVSRHIHTEISSSADALRTFEAARAPFRDQHPLYELDETQRPRMARPFEALPTSSQQPQTFSMLAWDPVDRRLVRVSLPLWMLHFSTHRVKMRMMHDDRGFDLERLDLDAGELERIGPALVFDFRTHDGARVLVWTH